MWQSSYEKTFPGLTKESVWAVWEDVNTWSEWDHDTDTTRIEGPFAVGTRFMLKPKGGPKVSLELTAIERLRSFTDLTRFPLARMYDIHELQETRDGLTIRNTVRVEGPLSWLWAKIVAQGIVAGSPKQLDALARRAQSLTQEKLPAQAQH